ncbi:tRNA (N(6)-L-threonylcarbamoyladenosine(37)-C(2))-methylthiotransferase MtaB [Maritalea sp.]|uniref:tRNA (N(6)-L-threonylcarbamoyladenosine(37)-C(2))- methylthiotransferase MtaB n=1 Tax=Maritalea sp. TaxID=2003361 RepID=UPI003EFA7B32
MSVETLTLGCRLNTFESEVMKDQAKAAGLDDVIIVNSCAVTQEAVRQTRQTIRKARRDNPNKKIIVTGCAAQTDAQSFAQMGEVDLVMGNAEKMKAETYQGLKFGIGGNSKILVDDIMSIKETAGHLIEGMEGRTRSFVQVQNGCDHRCTFCIIPYGRGPSRSVPMGVVVDQIKKLADNGVGEVVLTGVDITSYGPDLPGKPSLGKLTQQILKHVPNLRRLRISSIDSIEADKALMEVLQSEQRLMPHLHLSLQSGDNMILKRMKRRHLREDTIAFVNEARALRPDMVFGADIIAGFPTETDEMFANSMKIIEECNLTYLHVFPYSIRPGTPAAKMPQVDKKIAKARAVKLRAAGEKQHEAFLSRQVGEEHSVLIERNGIGRTEQFAPIMIKDAEQGQILRALVTGVGEHGLIGEPIRQVA